MAELVRAQRISVFLPANDARERLAAFGVLDHMRELFSGYTMSTIDNPVFTGYWFNPDTGAVETDRIVIVFTDTQFASDDEPALLSAVDELRQAMFDSYRAAGSPQVDVWVTVEAVRTTS